MHNSAIALVLDEGLRVIEGIYEDPKNLAPGTRHGAPGLFKCADPNVEVGDLVVVESSTRWGMTVFKVTKTDVAVDLENTGELRWAVARIDTAAHKEMLAKEAVAVEAIQKANRKKQREELRKTVMENVDPGDQLKLTQG